MTSTIYKLCFCNQECELILPSINDIKVLVMENEEILDMILQKKVSIEEEMVLVDSTKYKTALKNRLVEPVK